MFGLLYYKSMGTMIFTHFVQSEGRGRRSVFPSLGLSQFFSPSPPSHVQWPWANPKKYNRLVTPVSIQLWDLRHARSSLCPGRSYTCHMERATCSCMRTVVQQSTKIVGWSTSTQNKPHRIGTLLSNKKWYKLLLHFLPCCGLLHYWLDGFKYGLGQWLNI